MTDPAVEAAKRIQKAHPFCGGDHHADSCLTDAAREALKPIRELHHRNEFGHCAQACIDMHGNTQAWPCDTAKLVYPESEL